MPCSSGARVLEGTVRDVFAKGTDRDVFAKGTERDVFAKGTDRDVFAKGTDRDVFAATEKHTLQECCGHFRRELFAG